MSMEITEQDIYEFANSTPGGKRLKGNELVFDICPYCRGGAKRDPKTFSINIKTGQFQCKRSSCNHSGNMVTLAEDFNFRLSEDNMRRYNVNNYNGKFRKFREIRIESKDEAVEYMKSRGISAEVTKAYKLTVQNEHPNVLVFPFYDSKDNLRFIKYRKTDFDRAKDKAKEWCEANCMPILFGMDHCDTSNKTLIITEGQIDSLSVVQAGFKNAVSVPTGMNGFTWYPHCAEWLKQFTEMVIFGDCENGKVTLVDGLTKRFEGKIRVVQEEDYKGCKDANDILRQYGTAAIADAIQNAKVLPDSSIIDLADVEPLDIENMFKIPTQIGPLDKLLDGGLYGGQVVALTGKAGDGKSTMLSQLLLNFIDQGFSSFVYSGELSKQMFQHWLFQQASGTAVLTEGTTYKLRNWCRGKVWLYDSDNIDNDETEQVIAMAEKAARDLDCKCVIIDNLMTAIVTNNSDALYEAQKNFVGKLCKIAIKYNIVVILVAHPKKSAEMTESYDISGTSDIGNKVSLTLAYCRVKDQGEDARELKILKNRFTGRLSKNNPIYLYYDQNTKRIAEDRAGFKRIYGWQTDSDGFAPVDQEELPFD